MVGRWHAMPAGWAWRHAGLISPSPPGRGSRTHTASTHLDLGFGAGFAVDQQLRARLAHPGIPR
eukprot:COSAG01_NODE_18887_length_1046_cov_3.206969_1_plen_63_part_10